jgi:riboflavin synthase
MFTGIVEELGRLESLEDGRLRIAATRVVEDASIGDSIAVNGCCLTVVAFGDDWWEADVSDETISRTSIRSLQPGDGINLERAVKMSDRLGGHLVQGHVDGVGEIVDPCRTCGSACPSR